MFSQSHLYIFDRLRSARRIPRWTGIALMFILSIPMLSSCGVLKVDEVVQIIDEAIRSIEQESADWRFVLEDTRQKLIDGGQDTIANQIEQLAGHAAQGAGIEVRCTIGFARDLAIEGLQRIKASLLNQDLELIPKICQPVPSAINLDAVKNGDLSQITIDGYNLDQSVQLFLLTIQGELQESTQHFSGGEYLRTINVGSNGIQFDDNSDMLVIQFKNQTLLTIDVIQPHTPTPTPVDHTVVYKVKIETGCIDDGGTDGDVYILLIGERGQSQETFLDKTDYDDFEQCDYDEYEVEASRDLGNLTQITVWLKNSDDGWFLRTISVVNPETGIQWGFSCRRWLDDVEGGGYLSRTLFLDGRQCS